MGNDWAHSHSTTLPTNPNRMSAPTALPPPSPPREEEEEKEHIDADDSDGDSRISNEETDQPTTNSLSSTSTHTAVGVLRKQPHRHRVRGDSRIRTDH